MRMCILIMVVLASTVNVNAQNERDSLYEIAIQLIYQEQFEAALTPLDQLLETYPNDAEAIFEQGMMYSHLKRYDLAHRSFSRYIQLDKHSPDGYFLRSESNRMLGNERQEFQDLKHVVKLEATNADANYYLALQFLKKGKVKKAKEAVDNALKVDGDNPDYLHLSEEISNSKK